MPEPQSSAASVVPTSAEYREQVAQGLRRMQALQAEYGFRKGAIMFLTGMSAEQVDDLGGVDG